MNRKKDFCGVSKTPLSLLYEYCEKKKVKPVIESKPYFNGFHCEICVDDTCASGTGESKQSAKQSASSALLRVLTDREDNESANNRYEDHENPIMDLLDITNKYGIPEPVYSFNYELQSNKMVCDAEISNSFRVIEHGYDLGILKKKAALSLLDMLLESFKATYNCYKMMK